MCIYLSICFSISNPYKPFSVCRTAARNWTSSIVAGVLRLAGDYSKSKSRYSEGIRGPGDWSSGWRGGAVSENWRRRPISELWSPHVATANCNHHSMRARILSAICTTCTCLLPATWARIYYNLALAFLAIPALWVPVGLSPSCEDSSPAISTVLLLDPFFSASALCLAITKFVISGAMRRGNLKNEVVAVKTLAQT